MSAVVKEIIKSAGITPQGLKDMLLHVEDAQVSTDAQARIQVILRGFDNLPLTEGRKLLKETVKLVTDKQSAEYRTIKVKTSEARQIIGACKLVKGFRETVEKLGWHKAVTESREALAESKLHADGSPVLTEEQQAVKDQAEAEAAAIRELAERRKKGEAVQVSEQTIKEMLENMHQGEYLAAIKDQAKRIIGTKGNDYALKLAQELIAQVEAGPEAQAKA